MISKLSCSQFKPARFASPLLLAAAAVLFSFGPGAPRAAADNAPEWMHAAARDTMPPAEKDAVAVILLDETVTTVKENGEVEVLYRRVYKILRPEARQNFGRVEVAFDKDTRITSLKAWTIPATGKDFEVKEKDASEIGSFSEDLYNGLRVKRLQFPAVVP